MYRILDIFYKVLCRYTKVFRSFSSDGEDLIIQKLFDKQSTGFYIDFGAYKPIRANNTFLLYLKGWQGVLIDPSPSFKFWARIIRSRDKVLCLGVDPSLKEGSTEKKMFIYKNFPDNNTISEDTAKKNLEILGRKHDSEFKFKFVGVEFLIHNTDIFNHEIDIMNIDVEGIEEEMIESIVNINKIIPKVICVEQISSIEQIMQTSIYRTLLNHDYILLSKTFLSAIYIQKEFLKASHSDYLKVINSS